MSNTNTTVNTAATTFINKTFCDKNLLVNAKTKLCHALYGQKRNIPKNQGKTVEYRRWVNWNPKLGLAGLVEGVTPEGLKISQVHVEAAVKQYGAYTEVSDLLRRTSYDNVMEGSTALLGEFVGTVIEWVTRDKMNAGTNVQYAGSNLNRLALDGSDKLTTVEIRKAVRTLKKAKARMFTDKGADHFKCICSPDATYDLQDDPDWKDVSKYSDPKNIYKGEIGMLYGVRFIESTEAKVFEQSVLNAVAADTNNSATFVLADDPSEEAVEYLSVPGNKIKIGSTEYVIASYAPATKTVTLSAAASLSEGDIVYSEDAGACDATSKAGIDVHSALVFGEDAYGVIDIDGSGTMETIIKPPGSGGTTDPLNQRATVGAKVEAYTAAILNGDWLVRIEHTVSA